MTGRILVAVDEFTAAAALRDGAKGAAIALFPVTGDWLQLERLSGDLSLAGVEAASVDAAALIDEQVSELRTALPAWSDALAATRVGDRSIVEALDAGFATSVYWASSLVERNPLKVPELLMAAIARAFARELQRGGYAGTVIALRDGLLASALRGVAGQGASTAAAGSAAAHTARGVAALARQAVWSGIARGLRLGKRRRGPDVLCVTYFPYVDRAAAAEGRFVNRFAGPLQPVLEAEGRSDAWLCFFVFIDGWSFKDAAALARRLRAAGADIGLVDAYLSPSLLAAVLRDFWRISRRTARVERSLGASIGLGLVPAGAEVIATALWRRALSGLDLARTLLYLRLFERIVAATPAPGSALYFAEFQTWEQAFNAAARRAGWRTIGFQHTVVSRNHYFYARTPRETAADGMPMPSLLAAGGELPAEAFHRSGLATTVVESIRQLHLRETLDHPPSEAREPALLIAGSIDRRETRAMLALAAAAFAGGGPMPLRVKAHPSMPVEPMIAELGIDAGLFEIVGGTVGEWLARSTRVLVGSSAVAVEALAFGCGVIVPVFASAPCLTPLAGFENYYRRVSTPAGLAAAVAAPAMVSAAQARAFAERYWAIDPELPRWRRLLESN